MKVGRVIGNVVSSERLEAFASRKLMMVQPLTLDGEPQGPGTMAIDYVGAGVGDIVLYGAAPGLAASVFKLDKAPINELIMAIVDHIHLDGKA